MNCPILFLDIDGVLNSRAWWDSKRAGGIVLVDKPADKFDPAAVARLNRIVLSVRCRVVLSSSWRHDAPLLNIENWLRSVGFVGALDDKTPWSSTPYERHAEIEAWLANQGLDPAHPHVALDDEPGPLGKVRWVVTRYAVGLTAEDAERAIALLRGLP